jgi:transglutaminase-like putative cysteine protease
MRIRVSHETNLKFSAPVRSLQLNLRMTPRSFESQYVSRWRVGVDLDATPKIREDAFGSVVHAFSWHKPVEALTVSAVGEVQTNDAVGVIRGAVEPLPTDMFMRASALAQANTALREFAEEAKRGAVDTLDLLHRLMGAIHQDLAAEPYLGGLSPASEAFAMKKGGAADFAHVFIAAARAAGVPARFVTGYVVDEAASESPEMAAWAEAFAPNLGWVAFDAVTDQCPDDRYIRVAVGLDAKDAAPVRCWTNAGETSVTATLRVEQAKAQGQN